MATVLILTGSKPDRSEAAEALDHVGYHVVEVPEGKVAITAFLDHRPDCVVIDMRTPARDDWRFLQFIHSRGLRIPIMILSDEKPSEEGVLRDCLDMSGLVSEPLEASQLRARVEETLGPLPEIPQCA